MKKILLFAAAAATIFTSCIMGEETGGNAIGNGGDEVDASELTNVTIKIVEPSATRTVEGAASKTGTTLVGGYIYFVDPTDTANGVADVESVIPITGSVATDLTGSGWVSPGVRQDWKVVVVGNIPSGSASGWDDIDASTGVLKDFNNIIAKAADIATVTDYANAPVISVTGTSAPYTIEPIGLGTINRPNGDDQEGTATITVQVQPVVSRIEVGKVTAVAASKIASFDVVGVYLNNYNTHFNYNGGIAASGNTLTTKTTAQLLALNDGDYGADKPATPWSSAADSGAQSATPGASKVWAFNVVPGNKPQVWVAVSNVVMKPGSGLYSDPAAVQWLKVSEYVDGTSISVGDFAHGSIYQISAIEFDESDLTLAPENNKVDLTVNVSIGVWAKLSSDVSIVGDDSNKFKVMPAGAASAIAGQTSPVLVPVTMTPADLTGSPAGTPVTLSAPTNVNGWLFDGWTFTGTEPTLTDGTLVEASIIKFNKPTGNFTAIANYTGGGTAVSNPVGEVAIKMKDGVVRWAMTNLSDNDTFAATEATGGKFWMWGSTVAVNYGVTPSGYSSSTQEWSESSSDFSSTGTPCPDGWRLPTGEESQNLMNKSGMTAAGQGSSTGLYTKPGVGSTFWVGSGTVGAHIIPLNGDTQKTLFLPTTGRWWVSAWSAQYTSSFFSVSAPVNAANNWGPYYDNGNPNGILETPVKSVTALPIRCVR